MPEEVQDQTKPLPDVAVPSKPPAAPSPSTPENVVASESHQSPVKPMPKSNQLKPAVTNTVVALVVVVAGIFTGYGVFAVTSGEAGAGKAPTAQTPKQSQDVQVGEVYGAQNGEIFTDDAEGVLVEGGVEGEGSHHLLREGGPSRNVYLTSSVLDLDLFENHRIKVWGETFQAQKAGWLMDVGKVEVIELDADTPFDEE